MYILVAAIERRASRRGPAGAAGTGGGGGESSAASRALDGSSALRRKVPVADSQADSAAATGRPDDPADGRAALRASNSNTAQFRG